MKEQKDKLTGQPKRKLRYGRFLLFLLCFCAILAGGFWLGSQFFAVLNPPKVPAVAADSDIAGDALLNQRINVLILGTDDGDSEFKDAPKRADVMMVASFNPANSEVALLSLPRDTRVTIPGKGTDKINHAYAYGGVDLAEKTVAQLLPIPIHHYVLLDWQGFISAVNIIGGVDYYVEQDMDYEDPYAGLTIHLEKGFQHLDGQMAGEYVRFRHDELGDIGRVQRQQRFLKAVTEELFSVHNILKLPALLGTVNQYMTTDMDEFTLLRLANTFRVLGREKINTQMLYGEFKTIGGVSYWVTDENKVEQALTDLKIPYKKQTN